MGAEEETPKRAENGIISFTKSFYDLLMTVSGVLYQTGLI